MAEVDAATRGRRNRQRGRRKERQATAKLRRVYPDARNTWASGATPLEKGDGTAGPLRTQVKSGIRVNYREALEEAKEAAAESGGIPVAITAEQQQNGRVRWCAHFELDDLFDLIEHERGQHDG